MDLAHIQVTCFFLLVAKTTSVQPLVFHPVNQKAHEPLRLIRSEVTSRSLEQTRAPSVVNCYGSTCIINEEFCNETKKGCSTCHFENDICTKDLDCFNFCSEMAAQKICRVREGSTETSNISWWPFVLIVLIVASVAANIYCIIKIKILKCKRKETNQRGHSGNEVVNPEENNVLLPKQRVDIQPNTEVKEQVSTKPNEHEKTEPPLDSERNVLRGPIAHPVSDPDQLYPRIDSESQAPS
ncbi:hypothetical protein CHS0354_042978 [Potamilus streckersoni]|uniref:Uncharacterized protein n=1 Tax=Potamilus streckersoni TaxID=2493646 RepID=A0AAE0W5T4_9BIVA|nr:hypothetical protein CHS0354_042978 [Potamilus streckersoni]